MNRIPQSIESCGASRYRKTHDVAIAEFKSNEVEPFTPTFISDYAIIFLLKGGKAFYNNGDRIEVNENKVILLKRGYYLMCERLERAAYHSVAFYFNETIVQSFWRKYHGKLAHNKVDHGNQVVVMDTTIAFQEFKETVERHLDYNGRFLSHLLTNRFEELLLNVLEESPASELLKFIAEICTNPKHQIEYFVNANLFNPVSVDDLAKLVGVSTSTFKRKFQQIYGAPPKRWILNKKIEHADSLLSSSNKTVSEISFECGFENPSYFIEVYKNTFGVTPKVRMNQKLHLLD